MRIHYNALAIAGGLFTSIVLLRRRQRTVQPIDRRAKSERSKSHSSAHKAPLQPAVTDQNLQHSNWGLCSQIEFGHVLVQVSLAILATLSAEALYGRPFAVTVASTSLLLIFGVMASAAFAAAAAAWWQVGRHQQRPHWQPSEAPVSRGPPINRQVDGSLETGGNVSDRGIAASQQNLPPPKELNGIWDKDMAASDPMDSAVKAMRLNPIIRRGVSLVRGIEIDVTDEEFRMAVFSAIPWFKVAEHYSLSGKKAGFKRRDFRRGGHVAWCQILPEGGLVVYVKWGQPISGSGADTFRLASPGVLNVDSVLAIDGEPILKYRAVYNIRKASL